LTFNGLNGDISQTTAVRTYNPARKYKCKERHLKLKKIWPTHIKQKTLLTYESFLHDNNSNNEPVIQKGTAKWWK
jgi:hypothetical protein